MNSAQPTATQRLSTTRRLGVLRLDSIRNRILALAILATLLPSLATAWFSYLENQRSLMAKASEELLSVSTQAAREADLWIKERRYDLRVFASSYEVTDNLERIRGAGGSASRSGRPYRHLTDYLRSVHERFADYVELMVLDRDGRVVASSDESGGEIALPPDWQSRLSGDRLVLGRPYWNPDDARTEVLASVPVGIPGLASPGAVTARVSLESLFATLRRFAPGESGQVHLVHDDGVILAGPRSDGAPAPASRALPGAVRARLADAERPVEYENAAGEPVLAISRPVPGLDWLVVSEIPRSEVFGQLDRLRDIMLLIFAGMLAVAGGLGYALGVFIVRPLDRLTRGAAKVARGDLEVDLPVATGGEVGYLTEVFNDMVARLRKSRSELERLSVTDYLTGLHNRRRMIEALDEEVRRSSRLHHPCAVLIADVDNFKRYNDSYGHPAGDVVLGRVAGVLREATRDVDFVARYGGEEFFVLMPERRAPEALEQADRIRERLSQQTFEGGPLTLSIGIAEFPAHGDSAEALIAAADAALYEAKRMGRDRVRVAGAPGPVRAAGR